MSQPIVVVLIIAAVVVIAALAWYASQRRTRERLRDQFGPEYERTVRATGDETAAQRELAERRERVSRLQIRDLDAGERERYAAEWKSVQARFVDEPEAAVSDADRLVTQVLEARGYPMADFEQRAADISVDHASVVDHYRTAHEIAERGDADTEALREAMVHERALFDDLLGQTAPDRGRMPTTRSMEQAR